jgi:hypothetical protein
MLPSHLPFSCALLRALMAKRLAMLHRKLSYLCRQSVFRPSSLLRVINASAPLRRCTVTRTEDLSGALHPDVRNHLKKTRTGCPIRFLRTASCSEDDSVIKSYPLTRVDRFPTLADSSRSVMLSCILRRINSFASYQDSAAPLFDPEIEFDFVESLTNCALLPLRFSRSAIHFFLSFEQRQPSLSKRYRACRAPELRFPAAPLSAIPPSLEG